MKVLYLDLGMGAAGDMLAAALYELLPDQAGFLDQIRKAGVPGVEIDAQSVMKSGIKGTHYEVAVNGEVEVSEDVHEHGHHHVHRSMAEISAIIDRLELPEDVRAKCREVYGRIAEAEARVHGTSVGEIHFHEVGTMDAIADIASVCLAMHLLGPVRVIASPVAAGYGHVHCAHGILPVPAPATALLLSGVPFYAGDIEGELCTPTGAALVAAFVNEFGNMPVLTQTRIGYGFGKKEFRKLNCVRAVLGDEFVLSSGDMTDEVVELTCNIDDMTGEEIGFACEELLRAGALDVWTQPVQMKKFRPGVVLTVLLRADRKDEFVRLIFRCTTTIGIRETFHRRYVLAREAGEMETGSGPVRTKTSAGYGVCRTKAEYDDLAALAREKRTGLREAREGL